MPSSRSVFTRRRVALFAVGSIAGGIAPLAAAPAFADAAAGTAATVYVGTTSGATCSDTDPAAGSATTPFCTIQTAVDSPLTGPGTTVLVASGTYQEQVNVTKSGMPGAPITLRSASLLLGQRAEIEESTMTATGALPGLVTVSGQHDVAIDGLDIAAGPVAGVSVTGGSSNVAITRDWIASNPVGVSVEGAGPGVTIAASFIGKGSGVGTGVHIDGTANAAVTGNTIENNCGYGIELGAGATATTVENDVVQGNNQSTSPRCPAGVQSSGVQIWLASAGSTHLDYNIVNPYLPTTAPEPEYAVGDQLYRTAADLTASTGLGTHDIVADARLTNPFPQYTPAEGSPAIDSADENAVGEYPTDIYGNTAVDDPLAANTGTGDGIRDRGAVELTRAARDPLSMTVDKTIGITPTTVTATLTSQLWTPVASYSYDFGDGTVVSSTKTQMQHTYTTQGSQVVWVTALDAQGNTITRAASPWVNIWNPVNPVLYLDPVYGNPMAVTADAGLTTNASSEFIDFGDGSGSQPLDPSNAALTHQYTKPGPYTVTLSAIDKARDPAVKTSQKFTAVLPPAGTTPPSTPPPGAAVPIVHRIAGSDRYATSIAASQARWGAAANLDGAPAGDQAQAVVLARGDAFPDALAGVPLATYKHGPLLLTDPNALPDATLQEIRRVLPADGKHTIYILGGQSAVSPTIEAHLKVLGYNVVRYGGTDRAATALQIVHLGLGDPADIILATGDDFADALAAGPVASDGAETVNGKPAAILLSGKSATGDAFTDPATAAYITARVNANGGTSGCVNPGTIMAAGGPALNAFEALPAVHNTTHTKFACIDGIVGKDRYATASQLAGQFGPAVSHPGIATGTTFPDALSGGAYEASIGQPLLLTDPASLPASAAAVLQAVYSNAYLPWPRSVAIFGGTSAVSDAVRNQIVATVHGQFR
ncbi:hypothetical protein ABIA35_003262 [Catenulispora sp. MAP12-49]